MAELEELLEGIELPEIDFENYDHDKVKEQDWVTALQLALRERAGEQDNPKTLVGTILRTQAGDGTADYLVSNLSPLRVMHIPLGDAWTAPDAWIQGLAIQDVILAAEGTTEVSIEWAELNRDTKDSPITKLQTAAEKIEDATFSFPGRISVPVDRGCYTFSIQESGLFGYDYLAADETSFTGFRTLPLQSETSAKDIVQFISNVMESIELGVCGGQKMSLSWDLTTGQTRGRSYNCPNIGMNWLMKTDFTTVQFLNEPARATDLSLGSHLQVLKNYLTELGAIDVLTAPRGNFIIRTRYGDEGATIARAAFDYCFQNANENTNLRAWEAFLGRWPLHSAWRLEIDGEETKEFNVVGHTNTGLVAIHITSGKDPKHEFIDQAGESVYEESERID